ncbi:MAG: transposase [Planctomycetota bacterium]
MNCTVWEPRGPIPGHWSSAASSFRATGHQIPAEHRRMTRTTNPIERGFREVRRRTHSIRTCVNDASIERIV